MDVPCARGWLAAIVIVTISVLVTLAVAGLTRVRRSWACRSLSVDVTFRPHHDCHAQESVNQAGLAYYALLLPATIPVAAFCYVIWWFGYSLFMNN